MEYTIQWLHTYVIHFGAWASLLIIADVYKKGLPESVKGFITLLSGVLAIAAIGSLFSSHSHTHYMQFLTTLTKLE